MSTGVEAKTIAVALPRAAGVADYIELLKLRLASLVLVTTMVGFCLGFSGPYDGVFFARFACLAVGTLLVAGGAMVLNQYMERHTDALMQRTRTRPLPEGRITPGEALIYGGLISVLGTVVLATTVNPLTAVLGLLTLASYLLMYTPLKTRTPLCTIVGAISGAIPPMMGWTAATGRIDIEAWLLFAILFVWQMPHFLAIAWLYREDYARGRQLMLPVVDPSGTNTSRQMVSFSLTLLPVTLMPSVVGMAGAVYFVGAVVLGVGFLGFAMAVAAGLTQTAARRMFIVSIVYLPALLGLMLLDR